MRFPLIEGFDHYRGSAGFPGDFNTRWNVVMNTNALQVNPGLGGDGKCMSFGVAGSGGFCSFNFEASRKLTLHFAYRVDVSGASSNRFIQFARADTGAMLVGIDTNFSNQLRLKDAANNVLATSPLAIITGAVHRCVWTLDLDNGNSTLSIDGDQAQGWNITGNATLEALVSAGVIVLQKSSDNVVAHSLDDLILGIDACTDWGPLEVNTLPADGDISSMFARSAGASNFANVNNIPFDNETTYNSSGTVNDKDVFSYANPPHVPETILCVQLLNIARKEESAIRKLTDLLHIGGTDYMGDEHSLLESYAHFVSTWVNNPATSAPWDATALNALQGGYQLTVVA